MDEDRNAAKAGPPPPLKPDLWPTRDLVTAFKGLLMAPVEATQSAGDTSVCLPPGLREALKARPNANIYPYTKGPDLASDGIGYGEKVTVSLICEVEGAQGKHSAARRVVTHGAVRTRSGLLPLEPKGQESPVARRTRTTKHSHAKRLVDVDAGEATDAIVVHDD